MISNKSNLDENENENEKRIKIDLILHMKREKAAEKAAVIEEEKLLDEELNKLLSNAFEKLMTVKKTREQFSREEAEALKIELEKQKSVHIFLNKEQKERVLAIADSLGPTEISKHTGVTEQNIFRWRREGCQRKKGSGRHPTYPEFDKELVKYIKDTTKGLALSSKNS